MPTPVRNETIKSKFMYYIVYTCTEYECTEKIINGTENWKRNSGLCGTWLSPASATKFPIDTFPSIAMKCTEIHYHLTQKARTESVYIYVTCL